MRERAKYTRGARRGGHATRGEHWKLKKKWCVRCAAEIGDCSQSKDVLKDYLTPNSPLFHLRSLRHYFRVLCLRRTCHQTLLDLRRLRFGPLDFFHRLTCQQTSLIPHLNRILDRIPNLIPSQNPSPLLSKWFSCSWLKFTVNHQQES